MSLPIVVDVEVAESTQQINVEIQENIHAYDIEVAEKIVTSLVPNYEGEYSFTPTQTEQIVEVGGKKALENIVINPIPSNYGLITYNGTYITVS